MGDATVKRNHSEFLCRSDNNDVDASGSHAVRARRSADA